MLRFWPFSPRLEQPNERRTRRRRLRTDPTGAGYRSLMAGQDVVITLVAVDPPVEPCGPGVPVVAGVQNGQQIDQVEVVAGTLVFEVTVSRSDDGDVRGPFVHGKRGDRFLYVVWGVGAAADDFERFGRTKLLFNDVPPEVWSADLRCEFEAANEKDGLALASVRPPRVRWTSQ